MENSERTADERCDRLERVVVHMQREIGLLAIVIKEHQRYFEVLTSQAPKQAPAPTATPIVN